MIIKNVFFFIAEKKISNRATNKQQRRPTSGYHMVKHKLRNRGTQSHEHRNRNRNKENLNLDILFVKCI